MKYQLSTLQSKFEEKEVELQNFVGQNGTKLKEVEEKLEEYEEALTIAKRYYFYDESYNRFPIHVFSYFTLNQL